MGDLRRDRGTIAVGGAIACAALTVGLTTSPRAAVAACVLGGAIAGAGAKRLATVAVAVMLMLTLAGLRTDTAPTTPIPHSPARTR